MLIAVLVQVVATVKQLFDLVNFLFRVTNLVVNNSCSSHDSIVVKRVVSNISLLRITAEVIELVNVDSIG